MERDENAALWRRTRSDQERRLARQATDPASQAVHLTLAGLHERALETGDSRLLIVEDR